MTIDSGINPIQSDNKMYKSRNSMVSATLTLACRESTILLVSNQSTTVSGEFGEFVRLASKPRKINRHPHPSKAKPMSRGNRSGP